MAGPFPNHCMANTFGQQKIKETNPKLKGIYIENPLTNANFKGLEIKILQAIREIQSVNSKRLSPRWIYFEKQNYDAFSNLNLQKLLYRLKTKNAVVFGVGTDYSVKEAVLGMQKRGIQTYLVEDAIKGIFPDSTKFSIIEMEEMGTRFVKTKVVLEGKI